MKSSNRRNCSEIFPNAASRLRSKNCVRDVDVDASLRGGEKDRLGVDIGTESREKGIHPRGWKSGAILEATCFETAALGIDA